MPNQSAKEATDTPAQAVVGGRVGRWFGGYADRLLALRAWVVALCAVLSLGAVLELPRLRVDTDFLNFLPADDPDVRFFRAVGERFSGNYLAIVGLRGDVFSSAGLETIRRLTGALGRVDGVSSVLSLTNALQVRPTPDGIAVSSLVPDDLPLADPAARATVRERALGSPLIAGNLVSPDGGLSVVAITLDPHAVKDAVARRIRAVAEREARGAELFFAGTPLTMNFIENLIRDDMTLLIPIVLALTMLILLVGLRSLAGVLLPLITVAMAALWTMAAMAFMDVPLNLASSIMPVVLIANGPAYAIHLLSAAAQAGRAGLDGRAAVRLAMTQVGPGILMAGSTTLVGFISLGTAALTMFADFGRFSALGIAGAVVLTLTFTPAVLSYRVPPVPRGLAHRHALLADRLLARLAALIARRRVAVLATGVVLTLALAPGLALVRTDVNFNTYFDEDSEPRVAERLLAEGLGGSMPIDVQFEGALDEPLVLDELLRLEQRLRLIPGLVAWQSLPAVLVETHAALTGRRSLPQTRAGLSSLRLLVDGHPALRRLVADGDSCALLSGRLLDNDTASMVVAVAAVQRELDGLRRELLAVRPTQLADRPAAARLVAQDLAGRLRDVAAFHRLALLAPGADAVSAVTGDSTAASGATTAPEVLESLLNQALLAPPPPPAQVAAEEFVSDYLNSPECELDLSPELADILAARLDDLPEQDAERIVRELTTAARHLAEADPEGVRLVAASLAAGLAQLGRAERQAQLLARLVGSRAAVAALPALARAELAGLLEALDAPVWSLTPAQLSRVTPAGQPTPAVAARRLAARQTGLPSIVVALDRQLVRSQAYSLGLALALVFLLLALLLRSLRMALYSLVPILGTILCLAGLMGFLAIPVDMATSMFAVLAVGIGIDYTIHTALRLRAELARQPNDPSAALAATFASTGRSVLINAAAVAAGFLVLLASQIAALRLFGWLTALAMVLNATGALTIFVSLVLLTAGRASDQRVAPPGDRGISNHLDASQPSQRRTFP